jgi:predicted ferric reductase
MSAHLARALIWVLALVPALATVFLLQESDRVSVSAALNYLGRLTGIAGLTLMLATAILSCRVPGFDRPFGGLTKLWRTHHQLATAAFLLLLAHPLLLAFSAAGAGLDVAVASLVPEGANWTLWTGWAALLLMMIFLGPGYRFFGEPDYQRWKHLHRLAAPAVVLALIHTHLVARTLPQAWELALWSGLAALALISIGYRLLWSRRFGRRPHRVTRVERPANNVVELTLHPEGPPLIHEAGQFVYLTPRDENLAAGRGEEHPYTLSSAPGESGLRIAIKALGDASRAIQDVRVGSIVQVEGPYGGFFPPDSSPGAPELWIAGGIGITPFLARARHLADRGEPVDVVLIFCVQDEARALWLEELRALEQRLAGFRLVMHYFYLEGPLDRAFVSNHCPGIGERTAYICGPGPLLTLARRLALEAGLPHPRVVTEEFDLL